MPTKRTSGFRLKLLGTSILLLAIAFVFIPKRYQAELLRILTSAAPTANEKSPASKADRSLDALRKNNARSPRRDPKKWFAEVRARNPELEPKWRSVPDQENGFLRWLEFCEKHQTDGKIGSEALDIPEDISAMISSSDKWDSQAVKAFLDKHTDLLEEIARIGLLPSQSAAGIDVDRWHFVGVRFTEQCNRLLLADARLAVEAGDLDHAFKQVQAACGLANHYDQIEAPSLLQATVSSILRRQTQKHVMDQFLPALAGDPDEIARWREAIQSPIGQPSDLAPILNGEGWVNLGGLIIPLLSGNYSSSPFQDHVPDPDALFDAYAKGYAMASHNAKILSLEALIDLDGDRLGLPIPADHLSAEGQKILHETTAGISAWTKNWVGNMLLSARTDAALAIMQGEEIPLDPLTGQPYIYDPVARTVQVPYDPKLREKLNIGDPLKLP
jgi:hypothetical protein